MSTSNNTFRILVKDEKDIVGMIAYASYKRQKIAYCDKKIIENKKITEKDIENFHATITQESYIQYTDAAEKKILEIYKNLLEERKEYILESLQEKSLLILDQQNLNNRNNLSNQKAALDDFKNKITTLFTDHKIQSNTVSTRVFWLGILQGIIANIFWLIVVALILYSQPDNQPKKAINTIKKVILNKDFSDSLDNAK